MRAVEQTSWCVCACEHALHGCINGKVRLPVHGVYTVAIMTFCVGCPAACDKDEKAQPNDPRTREHNTTARPECTTPQRDQSAAAAHSPATVGAVTVLHSLPLTPPTAFAVWLTELPCCAATSHRELISRKPLTVPGAQPS
eukprot:scaffold161950_cov17-Tisochrysis_lutea.AAC.3